MVDKNLHNLDLGTLLMKHLQIFKNNFSKNQSVISIVLFFWNTPACQGEPWFSSAQELRAKRRKASSGSRGGRRAQTSRTRNTGTLATIVFIIITRRPLGPRCCETSARPSLVGFQSRASAPDSGIR